MGIIINSLTKAFGENILFSDLSVELPDIGLVRISGVSGAGKTTLLRMIAGLDSEYSGSISGFSSVSYAFQEYRLFPWLSALDNILVASFDKAGEKEKQRATNMLARLGFSDEAMQLKPSKLSGGMKQRVSLARAFLRDADVLILDEPTKELDAALVKTVAEIICEAAASRLILLVTHDSQLDDMPAAAEISVPFK